MTYRNQREKLRKKRKAQQRRVMAISFFIILGMIIIIAIGIRFINSRSKSVKYETTQGFMVGNPDTSIKVIAFSNYTCGACKRFSETVEDEFISNYAETGQILYHYVNLANNDTSSLNAAEASYCAAEQNKFFEFKTYLYTYASASDGFSVENLIKLANSAGLDTIEFEKCMMEDKYADAYLLDRDYAQKSGIRATPSFLVNDRLVYANELIPAVEALLEN